MKRIAFQFLSLIMLVSAMTVTATAQRPAAAVQPQRPRVVAPQNQPLRDPAKTAKQAQQNSRNLAADQPKPPKPNDQQQKNRTANAVVDRYLGGFQKNVGLTDEQTRKFSPLLGRYVRQQLMLAERRNELRMQLTEMTDNQAPEDQIRAQYAQMVQADRQMMNQERNFYDNINPQLSAQQMAKLRFYLDQTGQNIRDAIQKSQREDASIK